LDILNVDTSLAIIACHDSGIIKFRF